MPTSMRALAKLANPKLLENAQGIAERAQTANKKFACVSLTTSVLGIMMNNSIAYTVYLRIKLTKKCFSFFFL